MIIYYIIVVKIEFDFVLISIGSAPEFFVGIFLVGIFLVLIEINDVVSNLVLI